MRNFVTKSDNFGLVGKSARKLLSTTALTAAGLLSMTAAHAQSAPENTWSDHVADQGSIDIDTNIGNKTTDIQQNTHTVKVRGDGDIRADWTVNVNQLSSDSKYVLYDTEADATMILGRLNANGEIYIFDQNGVIFGESSQVDVGSIVAAAGTANYDDVISGKFDITDIEGDVSIEQNAMINIAQGGLAAFVGQNVSNKGIIKAKVGVIEAGDKATRIAMATGAKVTVDLHGDKLYEIAMEDKLQNALIENTGEIIAEGGEVLLTAGVAKDVVDSVINMDGIVDVSSATVKGGKIVLSADGGKTTVSGKLDASGVEGGEIEITSQDTVATEDSEIIADGHEKAGSIKLWGNDNAIYAGTISAQGKDGFIETSGGNLGVWGDVLIGQGGQWLLDPTKITIVGVPGDATPALDDITFSPDDSANDSIFWIQDSVINAALNNDADVTLQTNANGAQAGDIELRSDASILKTSMGDSTFSLLAHNDIIIDGTIDATGTGALNVFLNADFDGSGGDADIFVQNNINTNGGTFTAIASDDIDIKNNSTIDTDGGDVTITSRGLGDGSWLWMPTGAGTGTIETNGGNVAVTVDNLHIGVGSSIDAGTGTVAIMRDTAGSIGLGDGAGDMEITQAELERIDAANLTVGGDNTNAINVENVDTTSFTISNLVTLITGASFGDFDDVNFAGLNIFNALHVESDDSVRFADGAIVKTRTGGASFLGDGNNASVGDFIMGTNSHLLTNGHDVDIETLNVTLGELAGIQTGADDDSAAGNVHIITSDAFGGGLVTLGLNAEIDATNASDTIGGNILIENEGIFSSASANSLKTTGGATVDVNQWEGGSIQNAVNAIDNGGDGRNRIWVGAGTYNESVSITEDNFSLNGTNKDIHANSMARVAESIIDANSPGVHVTGDNVEIDGFTINGADNGILLEGAENSDLNNNIINMPTESGIKIVNGEGTHLIYGNLFNNPGMSGVQVVDSSTATTDIMGNTFDGGIYGVHGSNFGNLKVGVSGFNTIKNSDAGVFLQGTGTAWVHNNHIIDVIDGVLTEASGDLSVDNNNIYASDNGIEFLPFATALSDANIDITNNMIFADHAGVRVDREVAGGTVFDILFNTIGTDADRGVNGILFNKVGNATVNISGGEINTAGGAGPIDGDGINFRMGLHNGAIVNISDINVDSNTDEAVDFNDTVRSGATVNISSGDFRGGNNGVEFGAIAGTVNIGDSLGGGAYSGYDLIIDGQGTDKRGVNLLGSITGTLNIIDSLIFGTDDGVGSNDNQNNTVNGGTVSITGSSLVGENGDGLELGAVTNAANVTISGLTQLFGGDNGAHFADGIDNSTVTITGSTIAGENNGILFGAGSPSVGNGAVVALSGNGIYGENNGVLFEDKVSGGSTVSFTGDTISIKDLDFTVTRDGNGNASDATSPLNDPVSPADGVHFAGHIDNANVSFSGVTITATDDGIETNGITNGANFSVTGSSITAGDNGIEFGAGSPSVSGSTVEVKSNDKIEGQNNGIKFEDRITGASDVEISWNTLINGVNGDGILFGNQVNSVITDPEISEQEILIDSNDLIQGGNSGIRSAQYTGWFTHGGHDTYITGNTIVGLGDAGVNIGGSISGAHIRISDGNTITGAQDGVRVDGQVKDGGILEVSNNTSVTGLADDGVQVGGVKNGTVKVNDNAWIFGNDNGVIVSGEFEGANIFVNGNDNVEGTNGHGIAVIGTEDKKDATVQVSNNGENEGIVTAGQDGVHVENFKNAWISYNKIKWTGDDGIEATNGDFVSIYDNYIDLAGYLPSIAVPAFQPFPTNVKVGEDANGIYVNNVGGGDIPSTDTETDGFGSSSHGASVEIYGNEIANAEDDGIQVERDGYIVAQPSIIIEEPIEGDYTTYIYDNIVGHAGDDGIDVDNYDVTIVRENAVSSVGDKGITIDTGRYAGVFDNRVLLTGTDGIQVENIYGGADAPLLGDENYGYGWAVNVSGNEVAMTGDDGIEVRYSGPTKVEHNDVFMAGMGEGLGEVIDEINTFASGAFSPMMLAEPLDIASVQDMYSDYFYWNWGNGNGINVHGIEGAYYSPNGWAVYIKGNDVKYTGGHGINVENSDRTRIKRNDVKYAGIEETRFSGYESMMDVLANGPFHRDNPGRRDLWASEDSMIEVLDEYIGRPSEEPQDPYYGGYVTIDYVDFDNHDGIHAEDIYSYSNEGLYSDDYLFALKIDDNEVRVTGDDGIEVVYAGRTLIEENKIRDAGQGFSEYYGSGDYFGADGIHARYVSAEIFSGYFGADVEGFGGYQGGGRRRDRGYDYEDDRNYALIIRENDIKRTADDGIEVIGEAGEGKQAMKEIFVADEAIKGYQGGYNGGFYYGYTDRVLIAENEIEDAGVIGNSYFGGGFGGKEAFIDEELFDFFGEGYFGGYFGQNVGIGQDGYGHDGIHVRGIVGDTYEYGPIYAQTDDANFRGRGGHNEGSQYHGFAVDIIDNKIERTGDDGIEVFNSQSTLIYDNKIENAGVGSVRNNDRRRGRYHDDEGYDYLYGGADYYGADGIHVRNVGGETNYATGMVQGRNHNGGQSDYSVVIAKNDIKKTADDGIEVIGEIDGYNGGYPGDVYTADVAYHDSYSLFNGTGRTLIQDNEIRDTGVAGVRGNLYYYIYSSEEGSYSDYFDFGTQGSYDGRGGDGISVYGVGGYGNMGPIPLHSSSGQHAAHGRDVVIIGNEIKNTGDDGIEVVNSGKTLIKDNKIKNVGLAKGVSAYISGSYYGYDSYGNGYAYGGLYFGNAAYDGYGADGISVRNIGNYYDTPNFAGVNLIGEGHGNQNYAGYDVAIVGNRIYNTADDGIDVRYTKSAIIADNKIRNAGSLASYTSLYGSLSAGNYYTSISVYGDLDIWSGAVDETGGDAIHVEGVGGGYYGFDVRRSVKGIASEQFHGNGNQSEYAVLIEGNDIKNSADDGIEVLYSGRTRIEDNDVVNSGLASFEGFGGYFGFNGYNGGYNGGYMSAATSSLLDGFGGGYFGDFYYGGFSFEVNHNNGAMAYDGRGSDGIHVGSTFATGYEVDPYFGAGVGNLVDPNVNSVEIINNRVSNSGDDGIQVLFSGNTQIDGNTVDNSGIASYFGSGYFGGYSGGIDSVVASESFFGGYSGGYYSSDFYYYGGTGQMDYYGGDGIHVLNGYIHGYDIRGDNVLQVSEQDIFSGYPYFLSTNVEITNNIVTNSADDGIEAEGVTNLLIDMNEVDQSGDNGILAIGYAGFFTEEEEEEVAEESIVFGGGLPGELPSFEAIISNNTVTNSGTNNIESEEPDSFGGNGIQVDNYDFAEISGNTVENSFNRGIFSSGPFNGETQVFDNVLTNNDVHIEFQSGLANLVGTPGNTMNGGRVGIRFNPFQFGNEDFWPTASMEMYNWYYYPFYDLPEAGFADLTLVDNDGPGSTPFTGLNQVPTNFAGTIGEQTFNGQSQYFVEALGNFYEGPFWLNALDSTYTTPFGTITPSDTGGVLTQDQFNFLNDHFFDFRDFASVGIFFFGFLPEIEQEDIFNIFDPANLEEGGFSATVTGPVNIPGAPENVANISPFAGGEGEGEPSPESLNQIATAAGDTNATCWGDAMDSAAGGAVTNISAGTSFDARVDGAVKCTGGPESN